jgi:hypothetical protein
MSYAFVLTSAICPNTGVFTKEQRYEQTLNTIKSIRSKVSNSFILLSDSGPNPVPEEWVENLQELCDDVIFVKDSTLEQLNMYRMQTPAEIHNMKNALSYLKYLNLLGIDRVFKITGRAELTDDFNIIQYISNPAIKDKYVFKKSVDSWMGKGLKLYDTRIWSFDYSMIDEVIAMHSGAFNTACSSGLDLEHVYYQLISPEKVVEKDVLGLRCYVASDGTVRND